VGTNLASLILMSAVVPALWVFRSFKDFDEPMDGIVYGVAASTGFAALENLVHISEGGIPVAVVRALTAVPSHAAHGAIMGYFLGLACLFERQRVVHCSCALLIPIMLHGLYDFPLLVMGALPESSTYSFALPIATIAVIFFELTIAVTMTNRVRALQLTRKQSGVHETEQPYLMPLLRMETIKRRLPTWIALHASVVACWIGLLLATLFVVGGIQPEYTENVRIDGVAMGAGVVLGCALATAGIVGFRKSVRQLNREDAKELAGVSGTTLPPPALPPLRSTAP
jgi:hypothetical protein